MSQYSATYSPEDNKLRLYAVHRLPSDLYQRVSAAGFKFAPKQDLFVAPMWTPSREDLLVELCGEIGDEDTSLVERAETRAERFEDYKDSRTREGVAAAAAVESITSNIPLGQPILVGHHSERRARKDAERIENNMRRAVSAWESAEYWTRRAKGAISHAKYKERTDVRHRRIKGLEAERRKYERSIKEAEKFTSLWKSSSLTLERAQHLAGYDHVYVKDVKQGILASLYSIATSEGADVEAIRNLAIAAHAKTISHYGRWLKHVQNRIAYEREMLDEVGGLVSEQHQIAIGGRVLVDGEWLVVSRINKSGDRVTSVSTNPPKVAHWMSKYVVGIEKIKDYRIPEPVDMAALAKTSKLAPIVNYPKEGFMEMTNAEWKNWNKDYNSIRKIDATALHDSHRVRRVMLPYAGYALGQVYITDAKRVDLPSASGAQPVEFSREIEAPARSEILHAPDDCEYGEKLKVLRGQLRDGVQVVSAPQLFPTPTILARRMVSEAEIRAGDAVGEFSAGTGRILEAVAEAIDYTDINVTAVEINVGLATALQVRYPDAKVICADFLSCREELGLFDKIIINPPFANGQDIAHIKHALTFLRSGARLVAICANGPKQQASLGALVSHHGGTWEELPDGTFAESGTGVRTVMITIDV